MLIKINSDKEAIPASQNIEDKLASVTDTFCADPEFADLIWFSDSYEGFDVAL